MKHAMVMVVKKPKGLQLTAKHQVSSMYDEEIGVEVACTVPCTMVVLVLAKIEVHYVEVECMKDYTPCAGPSIPSQRVARTPEPGGGFYFMRTKP